MSRSFLRPFALPLSENLRLEWHEEAPLILIVVVAIFGALSFFNLPFDPPPGLIVAILVIFIAVYKPLLPIVSTSGYQSIIFKGLIAFSAGFMSAHIHTQLQNVSPIEPGFYAVSGLVHESKTGPTGDDRVLLCEVAFEKRIRTPWESGGCIRLVLRTNRPEAIRPGDILSFRARLAPPPGPAIAGGFNYARYAFFNDIMGVGYAVSEVGYAQDRPDLRLSFSLNRRLAIAAQIDDALEGNEAGFAKAISIGIRGGLSEQAREHLRDAGLAHLLAISGLHMGLIAAVAFFCAERLLCRIPALSNRFVPAKGAAWAAGLVAFSYLLLSGMGVSTLRAFMMVCIALIAILSDRQVLSLRSVALAAGVILVFDPYAVCHVSFHLSFAATAALVAYFERRPQTHKDSQDISSLVRPLLALSSAVRVAFVATLISQVAIAPFALYHFGSVSFVGSLANILVMPLMSLLVMPLVLLGLCLSLFGSYGLIGIPLSAAITLILDIAAFFSSLPHAVISQPQMADTALFLFVIAFLTLILLRGRASLVGASVFCLGASLISQAHTPPDLILAGKMPVVAYKQGETLSLKGTRLTSYRTENWMSAMDLRESNRDIAKTCDVRGCLWRASDGAILFAKPTRPDATIEDCNNSPILVLEADQHCTPFLSENQALVLQQSQIEAEGPVSIWLKPATVGGKRTRQTVDRISFAYPLSSRRVWDSR